MRRIGALEEVIGRELAANQRLTISVSNVAAPSDRPAQSVKDWTGIYEGLSAQEVDEIDRLVKTRANLTRPLP